MTKRNSYETDWLNARHHEGSWGMYKSRVVEMDDPLWDTIKQCGNVAVDQQAELSAVVSAIEPQTIVTPHTDTGPFNTYL